MPSLDVNVATSGYELKPCKMNPAFAISSLLKTAWLVFIVSALAVSTVVAFPVFRENQNLSEFADQDLLQKARFRGGFRMPAYRPPVYRPRVYRPPVVRPPVVRPPTARRPALRPSSPIRQRVGPRRYNPVFSGRPRLRAPLAGTTRHRARHGLRSRSNVSVARSGVRNRIANRNVARNLRTNSRRVYRGVTRRPGNRISRPVYRGTRSFSAANKNTRASRYGVSRRLRPANDNRPPPGVKAKKSNPKKHGSKRRFPPCGNEQRGVSWSFLQCAPAGNAIRSRAISTRESEWQYCCPKVHAATPTPRHSDSDSKYKSQRSFWTLRNTL